MLKRCFLHVVLLLLIAGMAGCEDPKDSSTTIAERQIVLEDIRLTISPGHIPVETLLKLQLSSEQPLQKKGYRQPHNELANSWNQLRSAVASCSYTCI